MSTKEKHAHLKKNAWETKGKTINANVVEGRFQQLITIIKNSILIIKFDNKSGRIRLCINGNKSVRV